MNKQTILFDLDDTLIHCNKYFNEVLDQFADLMTTWFRSMPLQAGDVKRKQYEFDSVGVHKLGFAAGHFPNSLVETYEHYSAMSGREPSADEREQLISLGKSVYEFPNIEPYPNMTETLGLLRDQGHELFLYTGGDETIQESKVKRAGLTAYFGDRLFISAHKTTDVLESILTRQKFNRDKTWMIGNSIRTDVVPALETDINAIHIPAILEWQYNVVDIDVKPKRAFLQLHQLLDVPPAIGRYSAI
ncbi:HAD family hydrolase [Paenibacillus ginsengarvi]|uniref:HAD family hydrolase n=1 Tax=Paenibacillus ginsengarvi TaxID=400777 RepID=A0A3B0BER7_9BACL|nr:HAD family hydrolase [Paenibacillus ginsengarvi]RKN71200.1 HAD family hydrolase [Paenibacillus ginsengarvi]